MRPSSAGTFEASAAMMPPPGALTVAAPMPLQEVAGAGLATHEPVSFQLPRATSQASSTLLGPEPMVWNPKMPGRRQPSLPV
jgi:hypothetical protein